LLIKKYLTLTQIHAIKIHIEFAKEELGWNLNDLSFQWSITDYGSEEYGAISGDVFMDNFSMYDFMERIGVDMENVRWER